MSYEITPKVGAGKILIGMSKEDVCQLMQMIPKFFRRNEFSKGDTAMFSDCFVNFDNDDKCESIEFFGTAVVTLAGKSLLSMRCNKLREFFRHNGGQICEIDSGFTSPELGISVYAPCELENSKCKPEAIMISAE